MKRSRTSEKSVDELIYVSKKHLCTFQKTQMNLLEKQSKRRAQIRKKTKISESTQKTIYNFKTLRRKSRVRHKRKKIDDDIVQKMIKTLHESYHHKTWSWIEFNAKFNLNVIKRCIKNKMNVEKYHKCRACQKNWINDDQAFKRVCWCKVRKNWSNWRWKKICFLCFTYIYCETLTVFQIHWFDECHFHQNFKHIDWIIRNKHEKYCSNCMQKRRKTTIFQFSIWAMIDWNYKSKLMFYNYTENVNKKFKNDNVRTQKQKFENFMIQKRYIKKILFIIRRKKNEFEQIHKRHMMFQKNNDDSHDIRSCDNVVAHYKNKIDFDYIDDWSFNSFDSNFIKNVWRILKSRIKLHHLMNHQQLRRVIKKKWNVIIYDEINECIFDSERDFDKDKKNAKEKNCHMHNKVNQMLERNELFIEF